MRVLKPGREQKGWAIEATCTGTGHGGGGCGALLLVEEDDVVYWTSRSFDDTENGYTFACVNCGVQTNLPINKVPNRSKRVRE